MAKPDKDRIRRKLINKQRKAAEKAAESRRLREGIQSNDWDILDDRDAGSTEPYPASKPGPPTIILEIELTLEGSEPPIRRTLLVPGNMTLGGLHALIQAAMGWEFDHLHEFLIGKLRFGPIFENSLGLSRTEDEDLAKLEDFKFKAGSKLLYTYDFGDNWRHELRVKRLFPSEPGASCPHVIDGAGACPPEDCGGIYRYQEIAEAFRRPDDPDFEDVREEYRDWVGEDFDPDSFDLAATDARLDYIREAYR